MPQPPPEQACANALADETSPYLLQHALNPVHWNAWGEVAHAAARADERPILLSIGYSACHWCHVMAHESFEDPEIAGLMNQLFVNIKVDREERPDLDRIYQLAHQLLTGRPGGWPLTVFLTPDDHLPFFAGTYFPPQPRHGMPSFPEVLRGVAGFFHSRRDEVREQNQRLAEALVRMETPDSDDAALDDAPIAACRQQLERSFDARHGGFGNAPKFPHPGDLERLLRHHCAHPEDSGALGMVTRSLATMVRGGLYDHLGGGFFRYCVDREWQIPHFEKMLYDNGPMLGLCAQTLRLSADTGLRRAAHATAEWTMREMQAPEGGYYATLDADSEGEEGRYYVWQPDEIRLALEEPVARLFTLAFGLDTAANFEGRSWHLNRRRDNAEIAARCGTPSAEVDAALDGACAQLLARREHRTRPQRDDKIIAAWNGLMARGMALAGRLLAEPRWVESATRALDFVRTRMWSDGRLQSVHANGRSRFRAYLDDYALLGEAALALLEARWRRVDLDFAMALAEALLADFEDRERGGFFFTAADHERLIHRSRQFVDDSVPAGNGAGARFLLRLGHLLGDTRYLDAAERALHAGWSSIQRAPAAHAAMLDALEEYLDPPRVVVIRGPQPELESWREIADAAWTPATLTVAIADDEERLPGLLGTRAAQPGRVIAYVCAGTHCLAPATTAQAFAAALRHSTDATTRSS